MVLYAFYNKEGTCLRGLLVKSLYGFSNRGHEILYGELFS